MKMRPVFDCSLFSLIFVCCAYIEMAGDGVHLYGMSGFLSLFMGLYVCSCNLIFKSIKNTHC